MTIINLSVEHQWKIKSKLRRPETTSQSVKLNQGLPATATEPVLFRNYCYDLIIWFKNIKISFKFSKISVINCKLGHFVWTNWFLVCLITTSKLEFFNHHFEENKGILKGFRSTVFYSIIILHKKNVGSDQFKVSFGWVEGILVQTP